MQPSFWTKSITKQGSDNGWYQDGSNIEYEPSPYSKETNDLNVSKPRSYFQLSFEFKFSAVNDTVFCAYTVPYSYTALLTHLRHLKNLSKQTRKHFKIDFLAYQFIKFESLGTSLGGLDIPLLKIANE